MKSFFLLATILWFTCAYGQQKTIPGYFCAACGCKNDGKVFDQPGVCPLCGMKFQQVGTFNFEMTALSPDDEIITFKTSKPDGIGRIFFRTPVRQEIAGEGSMPQVSPDKKWIVFEGRNNQILLYDIFKDTVIDISPTLEGLQSPAWLISQQLIFVAGKFPDLTLYQMNLNGKNIEPLVKTIGMRYGCRSSNDGKRIAYRLVQKINDNSFRRGLAIFDIVAGTEKYITSIGEYPSWSPDGRQLAFHWRGDKNFAVYTANADGSVLKKIAEHKNGDCELPVWSADGRKIFFQTNRRNGNWEIWTMNIDGSDQKPFIWN